MKKQKVDIIKFKLFTIIISLIIVGSLNAQNANITISISTNGGTWSQTGSLYTFTPNATTATINASEINSRLTAGSTVNISTACATCSGTGNIIISSAITNSASSNTFSINAAGALTLSSTVSLSNGTVTLSGSQGVTLNSSITCTNLNLSSNRTIKLNAANTISGNSTLSSGFVQLGIESKLSNLFLDTYLDLNGYNLTVVSLSGITNNGQNAVITNGSSNAAILKDSTTSNSTSTFSGLIKDSTGIIALSKLASSGGTSGVLTLTKTNSFSGATSISSGGILITNAKALGNTSGITITGGGLQLSGGIIVNYPLTMLGTGVSTTGALRSISGINKYIGAIALTGNTTLYVDADTLYLNPTNPISSTNNPTLTISGSSPGVMNFLNAFNLGTGALIKSGNSNSILSNSNTYSGGTSISGGALNIQNQNALGSSSNAVAISGTTGQLQIQGGITFSLPLTLSSTSSTGALRSISGTNSITGTLTLTGTSSIIADADTLKLMASPNSISGTNTNITLGGTGNIIVPNVIATGTGTLTKSGNGILYLNAANSYTGNTTISGGVLKILTTSAVSSNTLYTVDGTLDLNGNSISVSNLSSTGSNGLITNSEASSTSTITITGTNNSYTYSGVIADSITGTIALVKNGLGTQILAGSNKYSGVTNINQGILEVQSNNALGTTTGATIIISGAELRTNAANSNITIPENIFINGTGINNKGALLDSSYYSQNGNGNGNQNSQAPYSVTFSGTINSQITSRINTYNTTGTTFSNRYTSTNDIYFGGTGTISIPGINIGSNILNKDSTGTLNLTGASTYTGTSIIKGGTLSVSNNGALGSTSGIFVYGGGKLQLQGGVSFTNFPLTLGNINNTNGTFSSNGGNNSWLYDNSAINLVGDTAFITSDASNGIFTLPNINGTNTSLSFGGTRTSASFSLSGNIALGSGGLIKSGTNTLSLINSNTYTGHTNIIGGTLNFTKLNQLGSTDSIFISGGGRLQVQGGQNITSLPLTIGAANNTNGTLASHGGNNSWTKDIKIIGSGIAYIAQDSAYVFKLGNIKGDSTTNLSMGSSNSIGSFDLTSSAFTLNKGNFTKSGSDTLKLINANSYLGTTSISGGALYITNSNQIGSDSVIITSNTAQIQLDKGVTMNNKLSTSSTGTNNLIKSITGNNYWLGNITVTGSTNVFNSLADNLYLNNIASSTGTRNITFLGAGNINVNGIISNSGSVTKDSSGSLQIFGSNTYTGATYINKGNLILQKNNTLPSTSDIYFNGGALQTNNYTQSVGKINLWDNSILNLGTTSGNLSFSGYGNFDFKKLSINNWVGTYGASTGNAGTGYRIYVNGAALMTKNELDQIKFINNNINYNAYQLGNEIVPSITGATGFANVRIVNSSVNKGVSSITNSFLNGNTMPNASSGTWSTTTVSSVRTSTFYPNTDNAFLLTKSIEDTMSAGANVIISNICSACTQTGFIKSDGSISVRNNNVPRVLNFNANSDIFVNAAVDVSGTTSTTSTNRPNYLIMNGNNLSIGANINTSYSYASIYDTGSITINVNNGLNLNASLLGGALSNVTINIKNNTLSATTNGLNDGQISGIISGANFIKTGLGTFALKDSNTYTGYTKLSAGTLQLNNSECISNVTKFYFDGGSLLPNGFNETVDSLILTNNSSIYLDSTKVNSLNFSGMRIPADATKRLSIYNWVGVYSPLAITSYGLETGTSTSFVMYNGKTFNSSLTKDGLTKYGKIITGDPGQTQIMGHIYIKSDISTPSSKLNAIQFWNTTANKFYTAIQQPTDKQIIPGIAK